jgi:hypothetical protein
MGQDPPKRRRSKKTVEASQAEPSLQESDPCLPQKETQATSQTGLPDPVEADGPKTKNRQSTAEEKEEQVSYVAWWLARNGFFAEEVKVEIARKYNLAGKAAQEIIAAARSRHETWEQASLEGRRSLAGQWWISVVHGEDATLAQKMRAMECWQELHGLLRPAAEEKGPITITIIEQVITDRSQIQREESASAEGGHASEHARASGLVGETPCIQPPPQGPPGEKK